MEPVLVVPAVTITQAGRSPFARSVWIIAFSLTVSSRNASSEGTLHKDFLPNPNKFIAL